MHLLSGKYKHEKALAARYLLGIHFLRLSKPFSCRVHVICCNILMVVFCHVKKIVYDCNNIGKILLYFIF
jgi:hypothetical protein